MHARPPMFCITSICCLVPSKDFGCLFHAFLKQSYCLPRCVALRDFLCQIIVCVINQSWCFCLRYFNICLPVFNKWICLSLFRYSELFAISMNKKKQWQKYSNCWSAIVRLCLLYTASKENNVGFSFYWWPSNFWISFCQFYSWKYARSEYVFADLPAMKVVHEHHYASVQSSAAWNKEQL